MRPVALRMVTGGRLRLALAAFELERTPQHTLLYVPVGSPGFARTGARGGPRGSFLRPDAWADGMIAQPWTTLDVVMAHRFTDDWSTWRWLDADRNWTPGCYVNIERPWKIGEHTYDTEDLTLDLVVGADGAVTVKDADELAWAEDQGFYTAAEAGRIRTVGAAATAHVRSRGWPLNADWDRWKPPTGSGLPVLPGDWERLRTS